MRSVLRSNSKVAATLVPGRLLRNCGRLINSPASTSSTCAVALSRRTSQIRSGAELRCSVRCGFSTRAVVFALAEDDIIEMEIKVEGMVCGGCSSRVEEALKKLKDVNNAKVDLESKLASVEVKAKSQLDALNLMPQLVQTINDLGFEAKPHIAS
eukprot:CAMPEP_0202901366 /NCGR_PEP_ID=MMETSP1392-20130828/14213_1 /ASSEMBLY_ACC=CAM_ASM_000868 /TAXON_ID=225041 /ORGANISM="Chlamydomonas chlamydogama, Strain SAG 11-48b" /LENGTH=154 /DNA_ID=CAMNT_0049587917 /DNA_START=82 /DNA_END=546 /DNA_ORIENTATION=+